MRKIFDNNKLATAVALDTVKYTIMNEHNDSGDFRVTTYKGKLIDDSAIVVGKPLYMDIADRAYATISTVYGQYPVPSNSLCAFTGYYYVRTFDNGEHGETPVKPMFENDLILTYDRNSNKARLLRVRISDKFEVVGEELSHEKPFGHQISLKDFCGMYVEYIGSLSEKPEIIPSVFLDCDFPYAYVETEDDLSYLLRCRFLWLYLEHDPYEQLRVPLNEALRAYVENLGKLPDELKNRIDQLEAECIEEFD